MIDVLVVGAGPAGAVAALVLARAGVGVTMVDRADFPRDKLCGDSVNPGTMATLRRLGVAEPIEAAGIPVAGMRVTGEGGVTVEGRYPRGLRGRTIQRRDLDGHLVRSAVEAGAAFEPNVVVRRALVDDAGGRARAVGVAASVRGVERQIRARVVIAADGRRSVLAFGLGLARHPRTPRRWAVGTYYDGVAGLGDLGEMHVRRGRYIGVAPVPGGLANVCVVRPWQAGSAPFGDARALVEGELKRDSMLRERFADARPAAAPVVLGPLAVDAAPTAIDGLLLAGDAAGFIDPITGDGLRFAIGGGELAAAAAIDALTDGWHGVHARLAARRRQAFSSKWRINRAIRSLVSYPSAVGAATALARVSPAVLRALIARAGDCGLCPR
jgi:flavin-dependent dehydrogenase